MKRVLEVDGTDSDFPSAWVLLSRPLSLLDQDSDVDGAATSGGWGGRGRWT